MKIAQGLQVQKALSEEMARLRQLASVDAWSYRSVNNPDSRWESNFNLEENHRRIKELAKLHARIGQAIARTNLEVDLIGIEDKKFEDWF